MKFKLLLPTGQVMTNNTVITKGGKLSPITNEIELCKLIKAHRCKYSGVKSFTQWANELNEDGECGTGYTKEDALSNLCSMYHLNIDEKHIDLNYFFLTHFPFKN